MYGPIAGDNMYYYISVLNPSHFDLPGYTVQNGDTFGYGFAIILNEFDHNCQETTINLGTQVQDITEIDQGYKV